MNKIILTTSSILALLAGTASAQSSVSLYGRAEIQFAYRDSGTAAVANFPAVGVRQRLDGLTSQFGLRGIEDLGEGMRAYFVLENRFKLDTGAMSSASTFWEGKSIVGLAGNWGDLSLGRDYIPAFYPGVRVDPFGYDGSIGSLVGQAWSGYTVANNSRAANGINYKSPTFNGVSFRVATSLGEGILPRTNGANIEYANGPVYLGIGYSHTNDLNQATLLSGAYDFGIVRPAFWISDSKHSGNHARGYALALTAPFGSDMLKVVYHTVDPDTNSGDLNPSFSKGGAVRTKYAVGYTFALSKRTSITPTIARGKQNVASVSSSTAMDLVLRHNF